MRLLIIFVLLSLSSCAIASEVSGSIDKNEEQMLVPNEWRHDPHLVFKEKIEIFLSNVEYGECEKAKVNLKLIPDFELRAFLQSRMYQIGMCETISDEKAFETIKSAYPSDRIHTLPLRLGFHYELGIGTPKNLELARKLYQAVLFSFNPQYTYKYKTPLAKEYPLELFGMPESVILKEEYERMRQLPLTAPSSYLILAEEFSTDPIRTKASFLLYSHAVKLGQAEAKLNYAMGRLNLGISWYSGYSFADAVYDIQELVKLQYLPAVKFAISQLHQGKIIQKNHKLALKHYFRAQAIDPNFDYPKIEEVKQSFTSMELEEIKLRPFLNIPTNYKLRCASKRHVRSRTEDRCFKRLD